MFYHNIILAGGSTLFPGFEDRLKKELSALVPPKMNVKVVASDDRDDSVWIGGSILASLTTFTPMWVTRKEFEDSGPSILHKKCF